MENVIRMQEINGVVYPIGYYSMDMFREITKKDNVRADMFDLFSSRIVREGYMIAIENSTIEPTLRPIYDSAKVGGEVKCFDDPCAKCYLKDLCDDYCARYRKS